MVQLIDTLFVTAVVGASVFALIRYLLGLGKVEDAHSSSCSGCSTCNDSPKIQLKN